MRDTKFNRFNIKAVKERMKKDNQKAIEWLEIREKEDHLPKDEEIINYIKELIIQINKKI